MCTFYSIDWLTRLENHPRALFIWIVQSTNSRRTEGAHWVSWIFWTVKNTSVPTFVGPRYCSVGTANGTRRRERVRLRFVGGQKHTYHLFLHAYNARRAHTDILQEIKMISDQDYIRICQGNKRLVCTIQKFAKIKKSELSSSSYIWQQYFLYILARNKKIILLFFSINF